MKTGGELQAHATRFAWITGLATLALIGVVSLFVLVMGWDLVSRATGRRAGARQRPHGPWGHPRLALGTRRLAARHCYGVNGCVAPDALRHR